MNNLTDGCKYSPTCERCPLPECKAPQSDIMRTSTKDDKKARYKKVFELSDKGMLPKEICKKVGYKDVGDIYRILKGQKKIKA